MPFGWMGWYAGTPTADPAKPRGIAKRRAATKRARKARRKTR